MGELQRSVHRTRPVSREPWILTQTWNDLLFAHWPLPASLLQALVPANLPIDTFDGQAWIGVVPFSMSAVRPRLLPALPRISAFPELNVRTYVTLGQKPGVLFFSLDAANRLAVALGRRWYRLPYVHARMSAIRAGGGVHYQSHRPPGSASAAAFKAAYRPTGAVAFAEPGTLADWLTARYCLYTFDRQGRIYRAEIDHPPWPLQPAEAEISLNTMTAPHNITLPDVPPLLHFSRRLEVHAWQLRRVR